MIPHPNRSLDWAAVWHRMLQMLKIYPPSKITKKINGRKIYWRLLCTRTLVTQGLWVTKKCWRLRKYSGEVSLVLIPFQGWTCMKRSAGTDGSLWAISRLQNREAPSTETCCWPWQVCYLPVWICPKISLLCCAKHVLEVRDGWDTWPPAGGDRR